MKVDAHSARLVVKDFYNRASESDSRGDEQAAARCYDEVYARGVELLEASDQHDFYVGYGSTLKNVGRAAESLAVLRQGITRYPKSTALLVFLALTQFSGEDASGALKTVVLALLDGESDRSAERFRRAIRSYLDEI